MRHAKLDAAERSIDPARVKRLDLFGKAGAAMDGARRAQLTLRAGDGGGDPAVRRLRASALAEAGQPR
jgi:hypothetical protein